jgi:arsenate reductase-like glutaredoxin family protein
MVRFPKLMERAIVYNENKAFVCRPTEKVLYILRK